MIECLIVSGCDTHQRALGIDANGNLNTSSDWRSPGNYQRWQISQAFFGQQPWGMSIINVATGKALRVPNNGDGNRIDLVENNGTFDGWNTWTFEGDRMLTGCWGMDDNGNPSSGGKDFGYCAIRAYANDIYNLNIRGGCNNQDLCAWGWTSGARNEIWKVIRNGNSSPDYCHIQSRCGSWLGFDAARNTIGMVANRGEATVWQVELGFSGGGIFGAGAATACTFRNRQSGLMFAYNDNQGLYFTADPGSGGGTAFNFEHKQDSWTAIYRRHDSPTCLDVSGGCNGNNVQFYADNNDRNQQWLFYPL